MFSLELNRKPLLVVGDRGDMLDIGIGIILQIALRILAQLKRVETRCGVQKRFEIFRQLGTLLRPISRRDPGQIEILRGLAVVTLVASLQKCSNRRPGIQTP